MASTLDDYYTPPPYSRFSTPLPTNHEPARVEAVVQDGPHFVVGLDFGTTYSGLAWVGLNDENEPTLADVDRGAHSDWPGRTGGGHRKVPSQYSYSYVPAALSSRQSIEQWGYDFAPDSVIIRWIKLGLGVQNAGEELKALGRVSERMSERRPEGATADAPKYRDKHDLSKTPEQVLSDYLSKMIRHWYQFVQELGQHQLDVIPVDLVLTHPVDWPYECLNALYRAAKEVFSQRLILRNIYMCSEPEACALYTVQSMKAQNERFLANGESFICCDAGGGTIDLVTYRIDGLDPLKLTKVGVITGGNFGATLIDRAFLEWATEHITNLDPEAGKESSNGSHVMDPFVNALLNNFQVVKEGFTGSEAYSVMMLPSDAVLPEEAESANEEGELSISLNDMKKMFDKSVKQVVRLIEEQYQISVGYTAPGERRSLVTNVIMAGGFSESEYLLSEVRKWAQTIPGLRVRRADDRWTSVAKGAVLCGLGNGMSPGPEILSSPFHLGVCAAQKYQEHIHGGRGLRSFLKKDKFRKQDMIHSRITWVVKKGSVIRAEYGIKESLRLRINYNKFDSSSDKSVAIVCTVCPREAPPETLDKLNELEVARIYVKLREVLGTEEIVQRDGRSVGTYYTAHLTVVFHVTNTGVRISVEQNGKELALPYQKSV